MHAGVEMHQLMATYAERRRSAPTTIGGFSLHHIVLDMEPVFQKRP